MRARDCRELVQKWQREGSFDELLLEVAALRGIPQPEQYHAEGDAFIHTMLAVASVDDVADARVFWAVLLHDIGKAETTAFSHGRWRALGHAEAGAARVPGVMKRIGFPGLAHDVAWLVRQHLFHFSWHLREDGGLSKQQRHFMEQPLFALLLEVCYADAAGSQGSSDKGHKLRLIGEMYAEEIAGEKWSDGRT